MSTLSLRHDLQVIADLIPAGSRVLDLGCGEGELLDYLQTHKQVEGRGIELSQKGVSQCVRKGLSVVQGDAEKDLRYYPDNGFDYVVSSQMIQTTYEPKALLLEILRLAPAAMISIPNFGYWKNRFYLGFKGKMPVTKTLSYQWYETPNIHFCTLRDFELFCAEVSAHIKEKSFLRPAGQKLSCQNLTVANWLSDQAVYVLGHAKD